MGRDVPARAAAIEGQAQPVYSWTAVFPKPPGRLGNSWEQDTPVLASPALRHPNLAVVQVHVLQSHVRQFSVPQPAAEQQFDHDHMLRVACLPNRLVKRDQLVIRREFREPLSPLVGLTASSARVCWKTFS